MHSSLAQAIIAANDHAKDCCDCTAGKPPEYRPCVMAQFIRSLSIPGPAVDAEWCRKFVTKCREQTALDHLHSKWDYSEDELAAKLTAAIGGRGECPSDVIKAAEIIAEEAKEDVYSAEYDQQAKLLAHYVLGTAKKESLLSDTTADVVVSLNGTIARRKKHIAPTEPAK